MAAIVAAVLMLAGFLWWGVVAARPPARRASSSRSATLAPPGPIGEQPSVQLAGVQYYGDNALGFIGSGLLRGLGDAGARLGGHVPGRRHPRAAAGVPADRASTWRWSAPCCSSSGRSCSRSSGRSRSTTSSTAPRTVDDARDVGVELRRHRRAAPATSGSSCSPAGLLLVSLNAMRAGLLTRFLGILGRDQRRPARVPAADAAAGRAGVLARRARADAARRRRARRCRRPGGPAGRAVAERAGGRRAAARRRGAHAGDRARAEPKPRADGQPVPAARRTRRRRSASASAATSGSVRGARARPRPASRRSRRACPSHPLNGRSSPPSVARPSSSSPARRSSRVIVTAREVMRTGWRAGARRHRGDP